jgi:hypothetical protein
MALIGKRRWRLMEEHESLWYKVLVARFGEEGRILRVDGEGGTMWWNNLININQGVGASVGRWIYIDYVCELGDGASFLFWLDP